MRPYRSSQRSRRRQRKAQLVAKFGAGQLGPEDRLCVLCNQLDKGCEQGSTLVLADKSQGICERGIWKPGCVYLLSGYGSRHDFSSFAFVLPPIDLTLYCSSLSRDVCTIIVSYFPQEHLTPELMQFWPWFYQKRTRLKNTHICDRCIDFCLENDQVLFEVDDDWSRYRRRNPERIKQLTLQRIA